MVRGAAIGLVVSILLITVATWLMSTGTIHAQRARQHVFSGYVSMHRQPLHDGFVRVTIGPGFGLQPPRQEVGLGDIRQGRYKLAADDPTPARYTAMLRFVVVYQGREYERNHQVRFEAGRTTELNFDIENWKWSQEQPQGSGGQQGFGGQQGSGGMPGGGDFARQMQEERQREMDRDRMDRDRMERNEEMERQRMEMERQRMESGEEMDRQRMEMDRQRMESEEEMRRQGGKERIDMERQRMESEEGMRREQMEMERQRLERDDEMREKEGKERMEMERQRMASEEGMRREQMEMERERREMERQRMGRGQPGVQPVAGERPRSGPGRGLFSNRKAGEATSGIDNLMDATTLTIIGIVLTVLTTGMTLFKGD